MNYNVENVSTLSCEVSNIKQDDQSCNKFNSTFQVREHANVVENFKSLKKVPKILEIRNVNMLAKKIVFPKYAEKSDIIYNGTQQNDTYIINNSDISSDAKTYDIDNTANDTFAPAAKSTPTEKQSRECEINDNTDSDTSVISKNNLDDSFHLSDFSMDENIDEDEDNDENTYEHIINTSKNETIEDKLHLTSSFSSKIYDDRNMYVDTSENPKLKRSMCPYCKKLQTQFARHLELVHKTEEEVKKFSFLPKGK